MTVLRCARTPSNAIPSSFRDPSGFLFTRDGCLYRQINRSYRDHYDRLMTSGLYDALQSAGLLIPHEEVDVEPEESSGAFRVIRPEPIPFISYPYEWSFSQFRDAALATLAIQQTALAHDMSLKDASAYNIQFRNGKPVLIDTLSFEIYPEGRPWVAYRQFCQHFLGPLALMAHGDVRLSQLLRIYIDGIPLDLASSLLPFRTRFRFSLLSHIHLHAKSQKRYADRRPKPTGRRMGKFALRALTDSLESAVGRLTWRPAGTEWADYYGDTNYGPGSFRHKQQLVSEFLDRVSPRTVWDLGANTGPFSRIAADKQAMTVAFDIDPAAVEKLYLDCVEQGEGRILPLLLDLTNPSAAIGWANRERMSLAERGPADTVLALGLIHHLAISNNVPLERVAAYLSRLCRSLIIEFVPKHDSQVDRLLVTREDIFDDYREDAFRSAFQAHFRTEDRRDIVDTDRVLYLMRTR